ncbi:MAG: peptidoglycan DD-metalloendopeptidase family protein [Campylobacterota bacterium]|nr:peptidoglycan DD-metalloendopeptidase family protein [Campylobacterota bacterium]
MIKIFAVILFSISFLNASIKDINSKIDTNKKQFKLVSSKKSNINKNLSSIATKINKEEKEYLDIVSILEKTNTEILLNKIKLSSVISKVKKLKNESKDLYKNKVKIEKDVIDFVIEKYALSMGIEQANKETLEDVIGKEVYTLIFDNVKQEILDLNIDYLKVNNSIRSSEKKINNYTIYINKQNAIKNKFKNLEVAQEKTLGKLKKRHKVYQGNLKKLINKQNKITDLLGNLNILKKKEIKAEERRIKKAKAIAKKKEIARKKKELREKKEKERLLKKKLAKKEPTKTKSIKFTKRKKLDKEIDIEVRKIGSSAKGVKVSSYKGKKTIAPLKSYTITKKFGKYYDKVYKMELFNESVSLKTKKLNAKVFSVFKGQIVYAKQNSGLLANVVIVKHKNKLHTIYSHLDKISPTLKVGKWIPKGYVVGRINDTLEFQATKNSKYIDPMKLIKK